MLGLAGEPELAGRRVVVTTLVQLRVTRSLLAARFARAACSVTRRDRSVPMSTRLRALLDMRRNGPDAEPLPANAYVFGNDVGEAVANFKRAWERAVLVAHGHKPEYVKREQSEGKRPMKTAALTPECREQLRAINLHFHDLRREAGSRWLDAGVPLHRIQAWLPDSCL